ncbi:MAG: YceI family protein, partial [Pseudomonadota bacterium]
GQYLHDSTHASLYFSVLHLGLSNYMMGFTDYSINLQLDSSNLAASSVTVTINSASIRTDYRGDYKSSHPESAFSSWDQELAMSDNFFNAGKYPEIRFQSTAVTVQTPSAIQITGDLTLLGQTHPIILSGRIVGSTEQHPLVKRGAVGFSMSGTFKRSTFGMNHLLNPAFVGDEVTVMFEGEMHQSP